MYRSLDPRSIATTAEALRARIEERFPASGLSGVASELQAVARESVARSEWLRRPFWPIRLLVVAGLLALAGAVAGIFLSVQVPRTIGGISDLLQALEAALNDVVFIGLAVFFLFTAETRYKRRVALRALRELRSIAHVIDMHQLTKDPEHVLSPAPTTSSSPPRVLTRFELSRYLDYCSELLSIASKLAALHAQYLDDALVLSAVNDIQSLVVGLSAKIWQKIMILDTLAARTAAQ